MCVYWLQEVFLLELTHTTIMVKLLSLTVIFFPRVIFYIFSHFCLFMVVSGSLGWGLGLGLGGGLGISLGGVLGLWCGAFPVFWAVYINI